MLTHVALDFTVKFKLKGWFQHGFYATNIEFQKEKSVLMGLMRLDSNIESKLLNNTFI